MGFFPPANSIALGTYAAPVGIQAPVARVLQCPCNFSDEEEEEDNRNRRKFVEDVKAVCEDNKYREIEVQFGVARVLQPPHNFSEEEDAKLEEAEVHDSVFEGAER